MFAIFADVAFNCFYGLEKEASIVSSRGVVEVLQSK